jgi:hypothetical protein
MPANEQAHAQLVNLILAVWNEAELRSVALRMGLSTQVPGSGVTLTQFADELVDLLRRRGKADYAFFSHLADHAPFAEAARVFAVAAAWGVTLPPRQAPPPAPTLAPEAVPELVARATTLLQHQVEQWRDGYDPKVHACIASTRQGTLTAIHERLLGLDHLEATNATMTSMQVHKVRRYELRCLYGATIHWFALSDHPLPPALL